MEIFVFGSVNVKLQIKVGLWSSVTMLTKLDNGQAIHTCPQGGKLNLNFAQAPCCCLILPDVFDDMSKVLSCWPADLVPLYSVVTKQPARRTMSRSMGQTSYLTHPHMVASSNAQSS